MDDLNELIINFLESGSFIKRDNEFFPKSRISFIEILDNELEFHIIDSESVYKLRKVKNDEKGNLYGTILAGNIDSRFVVLAKKFYDANRFMQHLQNKEGLDVDEAKHIRKVLSESGIRFL